MLKEIRSDRSPILALGNGKTRVYLSCIEIEDDLGVRHYESEYIDVMDISYEGLVHSMIRDRYSQSEEFSLLRQRDVKGIEFDEYNQYCELCKSKAKEICANLVN